MSLIWEETKRHSLYRARQLVDSLACLEDRDINPALYEHKGTKQSNRTSANDGDRAFRVLPQSKVNIFIVFTELSGGLTIISLSLSAKLSCLSVRR